ncbi:hypothetical protein [Cupriavidus yeoncheonensis]|uniref:hypothetical protein n=1 Tax=Cupriavidus yeoncheonensis TaxID=1462994 RepID=UPI001BAD461A|nr:hypothetical protein [Cupriavidus yeoncheonensis]
MGTARDRKTNFYREHPTCCFCGGTTAADTQDHIPSRALFVGRRWPKGYVFPACAACNAFTQPYDPLTALLCRIAHDTDGDEQAQREVEALMMAIARSDPDLYRSFEPTSASVRRWLRANNQQLPQGMTTRDARLPSIVCVTSEPYLLVWLRGHAPATGSNTLTCRDRKSTCTQVALYRTQPAKC